MKSPKKTGLSLRFDAGNLALKNDKFVTRKHAAQLPNRRYFWLSCALFFNRDFLLGFEKMTDALFETVLT
jgi:hypothetical protein